MEQVTFKVVKANVYEEVAKTTSYTGAKMMAGDESAYSRIFTTDEDRLMLERFWTEAANAVVDIFKPFVLEVSDLTESHCCDLTKDFEATLELSGSYDTSLNNTVGSSLFSFFTSFIVGKWYKFTNKQEADGALADASVFLDDVKSKIYYRKRPRRIAPAQP